MHRAQITKAAVFIVLCWVYLLAASGTPAVAGSGACSVRQAHRTVHRLQVKLREARRIEQATRKYSRSYGSAVGRWVWLARQTGWSWPCIGNLTYIIDRESGGNPAAKNPTSTASGLLQEMGGWYQGEWWQYTYDPFNPRSNLYYGHLIWHRGGWSAWAL